MAVLNIDPTLATLIGAVLVVLGLALAFWGRSIMRTIMAMIGAGLGAILGFLVGFAVGGYFIGLILAIVFGFIGSILFGKLVKIGLALVMGLLAAGLVFIAFGTPTPQGTGFGDARVVGAIAALFVVFALAYYFIEEIIGIITAMIGGILVGIGMYLLLGPGSGYIAGATGIAIFLAGAVSQSLKIRRQKRAATVASPAAYSYPPPPPP